jgi:hypothetical protein
MENLGKDILPKKVGIGIAAGVQMTAEIAGINIGVSTKEPILMKRNIKLEEEIEYASHTIVTPGENEIDNYMAIQIAMAQANSIMCVDIHSEHNSLKQKLEDKVFELKIIIDNSDLILMEKEDNTPGFKPNKTILGRKNKKKMFN